MEENLVLVLAKSPSHVQMINASLMVIGETGHLGHPVRAIVKSQDLGIVKILLHKMRANLVQVLVKSLNHVLEKNVLLMVFGETGHLGHLVRVIVQSQDQEAVMIQLQKMEESHVQVLVKTLNHVLETNVLLMVIGEVGHLGHLVRVIA